MNRAMASLAGLNEGLRVKHIAAFPLLTCCAADDLGQVLSRPDLDEVVKLRNDVDHVKDIVRSDADLKGFVERLEEAETWLHIVKGPETMAASAGS